MQEYLFPSAPLYFGLFSIPTIVNCHHSTKCSFFESE